MNKDELISLLKDQRRNTFGLYYEALDKAIDIIENLRHITDVKCISYHDLTMLQSDENIKHVKEFQKKIICEEISKHLYDNDLIRFEEYEDDLHNYFIRAYLTIYERKDEDRINEK